MKVLTAENKACRLDHPLLPSVIVPSVTDGRPSGRPALEREPLSRANETTCRVGRVARPIQYTRSIISLPVYADE